MTRPSTWWLAWGLWLVTAALGALMVVLVPISHRHDLGDPTSFYSAEIAAILVFQSFATVGAVLASRLPRNPVGWLFCSAAVLCQLANGVDAYAHFAIDRSLPGAVVLSALLGSAVWPIGIALVVFSLVVFPDGRPLSPRWRLVGWAIGIWIPLVLVTSWFVPGNVESLDGFENPFGIRGFDLVNGVAFLLAIPLVSLAVLSLVLRFHRAVGTERQQMKVFVATAAFVVAALAAFVIVGDLAGVSAALGPLDDVIWLVLLGLIPVSMGVAILRYRLYEIDRVISRTIVYAALTLILGGAYAGLVLAGEAVFSSFAGGSNLAIAVSTLVVAASFLPLRRRIQVVVDRRFNRHRYDVERTLQSFGIRLREQVELNALRSDLHSVVAETIQPTRVSIWLRREQP